MLKKKLALNKNKPKKEIDMGSLFDYVSRVPAVPPPQNNTQNEYHASVKAWSTQSKRVKNCASSIELLYKDITRLNLLLRFLKSPAKDVVLKARLFTTVDLDSKLSKLLWKFSSNTVIRCDFVHIGSLPPLSSKDKKELSQPSHPHQTPGLSLKNDDDDDDGSDDAESAAEQGDDMDIEEEEDEQEEQKEPQFQIANDNDKNENADEEKVPVQSVSVAPAQAVQPSEPSIEASFVLGINEFYYLFLFLEDKLPELASWLMQQSELNQSHVLLRALSAKLIDGDAAQHTVLEDDEEEKKEPQQQQGGAQMAKTVMNEVDEEVCIICFEKLSNPVCLTCGHEYCKECIDNWQQQVHNDMGSGRECPICRSLIEQSQMWVKLDSEEFSQSQYMCELLQFPFEYVSKFKPWTDADADANS